MSLSNINRIVYNEEFYLLLEEIIYSFVYEYQDEFAARGFLKEYYSSIERLRSVEVSDGLPIDEEMAENGFRRMLLKKYKYVIVYYFDERNRTVYVHGIYSQRSNYFRFFK